MSSAGREKHRAGLPGECLSAERERQDRGRRSEGRVSKEKRQRFKEGRNKTQVCRPRGSKPFPSSPVCTLRHKSLLPWGISVSSAVWPTKDKYSISITKLSLKLRILGSNNFQLDANAVASYSNECSHSVFGI